MHRLTRRLALPSFAAFLAASILAGCGHSSPSPPSRVAQPAGTRLAPATCTALEPPCTAITPEGAKGADQTHDTNAERLPLTLTGSAIKIDGPGLTLIENFEEVQKATYCPYWDAYGHVWTRGFGETDWTGDFGGVCISHARAESNLAYLIETQYQYAVRDLGVSFDHHQIDALDSFAWNLGAGIFTGSLRYAIQHFDPYPMLAYDRAGGVVLSGLKHRREVEVALFLKPEAKPAPISRAQRQKELDQKYKRRAGERAFLSAHHCRQPPWHAAKPPRYAHACHVELRNGALTNKSIGEFHRLYHVY